MILEIDNIASNYGAIEALKSVSLTVNQGEIVTLIGSNGAGKSTTLMCVSKIKTISSGTIKFQGQDIKKFSAHELVKQGLAQVPEGRKIFPRLSVLENLELGAYTRSDKTTEDFNKVFELFPVLAERKTQLGGTLSGGEQQMLAIGRALMSKPKLLLLDEPSMGIAPLLVAKIFAAIEKLNKEGISILLVEQNAHAALKLAHRAYVIETGSSTISGQASELLSDNRIKEAYLGE